MNNPVYPDIYRAADTRYTGSDEHPGVPAVPPMPYRRSGVSGLTLPAITLGLWHNFGSDRPLQNQREILRHAFDRGVTHFDLANNYGPVPGAAEENFGRIIGVRLPPVPR